MLPPPPPKYPTWGGGPWDPRAPNPHRGHVAGLGCDVAAGVPQHKEAPCGLGGLPPHRVPPAATLCRGDDSAARHGWGGRSPNSCPYSPLGNRGGREHPGQGDNWGSLPHLGSSPGGHQPVPCPHRFFFFFFTFPLNPFPPGFGFLLNLVCPGIETSCCQLRRRGGI